MQSTTVERYRAAWKMRDSRPCVILVQEDGVTVHRWPDGVSIDAARTEHPELSQLWAKVREAGHRQHLAESPGARHHADFFHQPNVLMPSTPER